MNKTQKYSIQGAICVGLLKGALNTASQLDQINNNSQQKFNWTKLFQETGKGILIGGAGGAIIGAIEDYQNSLEKPLDTNEILHEVAAKIRLRKNDSAYICLQQKADTIMNLLKKEYGDYLASEPFRIGSTQRGTALRNKCDIDIALSFKKGSFRSTADMFNDVYTFLKGRIGKFSIVNVRDQHVSIGVFLNITGKQYKIDVVPKKRSKSGDKDKSGYLFVNDKNFLANNSSYTKTNFHALNSIRVSDTQKTIIILLKYWKEKNDLPLSSHLLENLVLDAYERNRFGIPATLTHKLIMVLRHIADNLSIAVIRSVENTNNILTDISDEDKKIIVNACNETIDDFCYQPNSIIEHLGRN